ncbi:MAG: Flp pilus assembly complex ATPase component TadA [Phycisphaerales bacterium]|nr:Flp pilus assembly complex ATPase component TadA [Phycisphaerales bacterium]
MTLPAPETVPTPGATAIAEAPPARDLRAVNPSPEFLRLIDHNYARRHLVLSAGASDGVERLLVAETTGPLAVFNVGVRLGQPVEPEIHPGELIASAIDRAYAARAHNRSDTSGNGSAPGDGPEVPKVTIEGSSDVERDLEAAVRDAESDLLSTQGKAPTVRLVDLVLFEALQRGASDVHIQPVRDLTLIRYRLDGSLHTVRELPGALAAGVTTRIKVMARLDVAEQRSPQDGRATVTIGTAPGSASSSSGGGGRRIDLRVSTLPSTYGQRVVLRLLDPARSPHLLNFAALGMPSEVEQKFLAQVSKTSGIVLSTGPTGSGKTTTLYATLAWISATNGGELPQGRRARSGGGHGSELNIMTVEDPVEYDLSGPGLSVSQTQVDLKKGLTFAAGLRHILRQDPDVIMVGEIRDEETARVAVQSSLTGHLVLSTLHTNDAASAVARLVDLGVDPFLVNSSLSAVLAQRLVRKIHSACSGRGCSECLDTGFRGRLGVFELLVLDVAMKALIARRCSAPELKAQAQRASTGGGGGMVTLREAGSSLVRAGITTEAEVTRVIEALEATDGVVT